MDKKKSKNKKSKIKRSQAKRRKRLLSAQRAAEEGREISTYESNLQVDQDVPGGSHDSKRLSRVAGEMYIVMSRLSSDKNVSASDLSQLVYANIPEREQELIEYEKELNLWLRPTSRFGTRNFIMEEASRRIMKDLMDLTGTSNHIDSSWSNRASFCPSTSTRCISDTNDEICFPVANRGSETEIGEPEVRPMIPIKQSSSDAKVDAQEKTHEQIKPQREAIKAAKAVAKQCKTSTGLSNHSDLSLDNRTSRPSTSTRWNSDTNEEMNVAVATKDTRIETSKVPPMSPIKQSLSDAKMDAQEKTREQVKAEREAKKAAKAAAKGKGKATKMDIPNETVSTSSTSHGPRTPSKSSKVDAIANCDGVASAKQFTTSVSKKNPDATVTISSEAKSDGKSKAELRAERRAKQEAQRAAKQGQVVEKGKPKTVDSEKVTISQVKDEDLTKKIVKRTVVKENAHEVNLFKHLYHERELALIRMPTVNSNIHPAIVRLGVQYADKVIVGSNARCVALLAAVKQLIVDFERPSQADFTRGLEATLQESSTYLHHCRPLAVSMQNALRHLKWQMTQLPATASDKEAKTKLGTAIDTYIQEQILLADKAISITIQTKISKGDVILTYGYSSLIYKILCDAYDAGKQFRVVVVDGRPWLEGREQLRRLAKHGLECSYMLINALSFIMPEVSKVFLGAHAILANGAVMSRVGTAQVALMAKAFNVPVLVACETHKTCERVQTDSIVYNEIADPDELAQNLVGNRKKTTLVNWKAKKSLNLLNITYDVMPADLVTAVVTELAILPCTSVPVILRIKPSEI